MYVLSTIQYSEVKGLLQVKCRDIVTFSTLSQNAKAAEPDRIVMMVVVVVVESLLHSYCVCSNSSYCHLGGHRGRGITLPSSKA